MTRMQRRVHVWAWLAAGACAAAVLLWAWRGAERGRAAVIQAGSGAGAENGR